MNFDLTIFDKLQPGHIFQLTPTARIQWLVFGGYKQNDSRVQIDAVRCDTEIGQKLLAWIKAGSDLKNPPASRMEVMEYAKHFYRDDLAQARLVA